ncbi:S phase cyclin A-associated protein in the endoplasmic reticulum isoform X2 [Hydra vulgaris]|uniref:S phase cyclin A-associated protein in the endoplasmic reticulum isoform X2 n=1 Tax=Hydra vulgaris TaxID=6087 RepID=A0ABM4DCZ6_HYDVU
MASVKLIKSHSQSSISSGGSEKNGRQNKIQGDFKFLERSGSGDNVRNIVEKEGKSARNLLTWSVPTTDQGINKRGRSRIKYKNNRLVKEVNQSRQKKKKPINNIWVTSLNNEKSSTDCNLNSQVDYSFNQNIVKDVSQLQPNNQYKLTEKVSKLPGETTITLKDRDSRSLKSATNQQPNLASFTPQSQKNLHARYWSYLLDHFHRVFDELYNTCESDECILECQEVILMIDVCKRDFKQLIRRLELFNQLKNSEARPQALAWEVRKQSSPGKNSPVIRRSPSPGAMKFLNFGSSKNVSSWADCLKGINLKEPSKNILSPVTVKNVPSPVLEGSHDDTYSNETKDNDNEGWEVVRKGRLRSKESSFVSSTSSQNIQVVKEKQISNQSSSNTSTSTMKEKSEASHKSFVSIDSTNVFSEDQFYDEVYADLNRDTFSYDLTDDDLNKKIKEEQEKALASAIAEEETLRKELEEEALKDDDQDYDISSDRDYATTDDGRETPKDLSDDLPLDPSTSFDTEKSITWEEMCAQYDQDHADPSFNWADAIEQTESVRLPGHALVMHQKLSSPSRKQSRSDSVKRSQDKMVRAERRRLRLLIEKCQRLKVLSERVRNVRSLKNRLIADKERSMLEQMKKAELNRMIVLQEKIKKAQEEEAKVNEIAFINSLEAQNKKIEVLEKHQGSEARLHDLLEERQRRRTDKQAKEEAAQERRRALEEERQARLQDIKQRRGTQAEKWLKERIEREKLREEIAKEKQKEREMKVAARNEALQQASEELQKRIEQKHIESTRRHEQRIEDIKERAASSSRHGIMEDSPSAIPYSKLKMCTLCNVEIASDVYMVSHLKGKVHKTAVKELNKKITDAEMEAFSSKYIKEAEINYSQRQKENNDHIKSMKKRAKKIKSRMNAKGKDFEASYQSNLNGIDSLKRGKLQKSVKDITNLLQGHSNVVWPKNKVSALDKSLNEIMRSLDGSNINDQKVFCHLGGLTALSRVLLLWDISNIDKIEKTMSSKTIIHAIKTIKVACIGCFENCHFMLLGNKLSILVDLLSFALNKTKNVNEQNNSQNIAELSTFQLLESDFLLPTAIMETIATIISPFAPVWPYENKASDVSQRLPDLISYLVCNGILEKLISVYADLQASIDDSIVFSIIKSILEFYKSIAICSVRVDGIFCIRKDDMSPLSQVICRTDALGLIGFLYLLLHQGSVMRIQPSPFPLSENTITLLTSTFKLLNELALVDIHSFQNTLCKEGISLQYRSVVSYVLRYTLNEKCDDLLHEVILSLGYFCVLHEENQLFLQTGRAPSLGQQLCTLPFSYFSDPKLTTILFPTLICLCYKSCENKAIISQDVSPSLLALFLQEKINEKRPETVGNNKTVEDIEQRSKLDFRFPRELWEEAKLYLSETK